ncbi:MBL fold metallo-hydrolase [Pendulispora rubella]|uniref:MBL fold metallo-hydrolase n=1 Tax=Pendulispora rubella TaxID=2741070 RepID=A0ABZ2KTG5_9BACT
MRHVLLTSIALVSIQLGCARAPQSSASQGAASAGGADSPRCTSPAAPRSANFALIVLGSGGPRSFGRAESSYVVLVDGIARVLVDVGPGAVLRLGQLGIDYRRLDTVLLTHLHIDHSADLPAYVKSRDLTYDEPLAFRFFGPDGGGEYPSTSAFVDRLLGARGAFAYLPKFRNELRLTTVDLPTDPGAPIHEVLREPDLHVTSVAVDHDDVPAVAFRIEHGGHSLVVSGDLASKNDNLIQLAAGADVLVYDTAVPDPPGSPPSLYALHTPPKRIGDVAAKAHVKSLILSHIPPSIEKGSEGVLRSVRASYGGPVHFAIDCLHVDLSSTK